GGSFPDVRPLGLGCNFSGQSYPPEGTVATIFSHKRPTIAGFAQPGPAPPGASPTLSPCIPPQRRTTHARRRRSHRFRGRSAAHPEAQARRSWLIRSRIRANSCCGTATSANWKVRYLAWATTLAPILISFSRSVVSIQPWIGLGSTSCRRKLARLYARANGCSHAALSWNRRKVTGGLAREEHGENPAGEPADRRREAVKTAW